MLVIYVLARLVVSCGTGNLVAAFRTMVNTYLRVVAAGMFVIAAVGASANRLL